ncbi:hypothetical protein [Luteitalea pratensis]|nr:hypothetical protein [Luteitalea pratensis]
MSRTDRAPPTRVGGNSSRLLTVDLKVDGYVLTRRNPRPGTRNRGPVTRGYKSLRNAGMPRMPSMTHDHRAGRQRRN